MVIGMAPCAAALDADSVRTLAPAFEMAPKDAVTPLGSVEVTARFTLPLKPPASITEIVAVALEPCTTATLPVEEVIQNPGTAFPAKSSISDWPAGEPQPVTRSYPATALNQAVWLRVSLLPD